MKTGELIANAYQLFEAASDDDHRWQLLNGQLSMFGVTSILFGMCCSVKEREIVGLTKSLIIRSNHPEEYFETFGADTLLDNDITAQALFDFQDNVIWSDENVWSNASPQERKQAEIECDLGLRVGVSISVHEIAGPAAGFGLNMANIRGEDFPQFFSENQAGIKGICYSYFEVCGKQRGKGVVTLTPRELDCIAFLAAGFGPDAIADKMGISYKTLEKHLANSRLKLGARTREQAIARAMSLNLISL